MLYYSFLSDFKNNVNFLNFMIKSGQEKVESMRLQHRMLFKQVPMLFQQHRILFLATLCIAFHTADVSVAGKV